jgi:5-methylcytosine-specific restriction endonuclease McrA
MKSYKPKRHEGSRQYNPNKFADALYDYDWIKYRDGFLFANPKCYCCGATATVVDHVTPHKGDPWIFWKEDNYIPLCAKCHNTITTLFDKHHKRGGPIYKKLWWIEKSRKLNPASVPQKVKIIKVDIKIYRKECFGIKDHS